MADHEQQPSCAPTANLRSTRSFTVPCALDTLASGAEFTRTAVFITIERSGEGDEQSDVAGNADIDIVVLDFATADVLSGKEDQQDAEKAEYIFQAVAVFNTFYPGQGRAIALKLLEERDRRSAAPNDNGHRTEAESTSSSSGA